MAICDDCASKHFCTFPRTENTYSCEEYDASAFVPEDRETIEWDLTKILADWGFVTEEKA